MSKYLYHDYWVVERNGVYWTDYIDSQEECFDVIYESATRLSDDIDIYQERLMNDEDIETHYPKIVENYIE